MNQSNIIAAFLFAAFVIFITMRGELGIYMGFLLGAGSGTAAPGNTSGSATNPGTGAVSFLGGSGLGQITNARSDTEAFSALGGIARAISLGL